MNAEPFTGTHHPADIVFFAVAAFLSFGALGRWWLLARTFDSPYPRVTIPVTMAASSIALSAAAMLAISVDLQWATLEENLRWNPTWRRLAGLGIIGAAMALHLWLNGSDEEVK